MAALYTAIEKPVIIPLIYLTIALWPLAWLMNWMSYFNGSAHRSTHKTSFAGNESAANSISAPDSCRTLAPMSLRAECSA